MTPDLLNALQPLLTRLNDYLRDRPDLSREIAEFGRALTAWAEGGESVAPRVPSVETPYSEVNRAGVPTASTPETRTAPSFSRFGPPGDLSQLNIPILPRTEPTPAAVLHGPGGEIVPQQLTVIVDRAKLKAETSRFVGRRVSGENVDVAEPAELIRRARLLPDCHLWLLDTWGFSEKPAVWADLAGAFETVADAVGMLAIWRELPDSPKAKFASEALHLAAEAQAVLFAAVADTGKQKPDIDQLNLFVTIREEAEARRVYVSRYLRKEDRASPAAGPEVSKRIAELVGALRQFGESSKVRQKLLKNLAYKVGLLEADPVGAAGEWPRILEILETLVSGGMPPSNIELRERILPLCDLLPDDLPLTPNVALVFRELDQYMAIRAETLPPALDVETEAPSGEVAEVIPYLKGRQLVLIGGLVRPDRKAALIRAFGLSDLEWVTTPEHQSYTVFEPAVARPEVAVVLLAIRWSSHSYTEVQQYCEKYAKPLVRLPGGYNPNQVAHQILTQVGSRLKGGGGVTDSANGK